jgi:O-antigen/teichoic acid export membrane protein
MRIFPKYGEFISTQSGMLFVFLNAVFLWPLLGSQLSAEDFGKIVFVLSITSLAGPIITFGLGISLSYHSLNPNSRVLRPIKHLASISTLVLTGLITVVFALQFVLAESYFLWIAVIALSSSISLISVGATRNAKNPLTFALTNFFSSFVGFGLMTLSFAVYDSFALASIGYFISSLFLAALVFSNKSLSWPNSQLPFEKPQFSEAVKLSMSLAIHQSVSVGMILGIRVIVGITLGDKALGEFLFSALILGTGLTVLSSLDAFWSVRAQRASSISAILERQSSALTRGSQAVVILSVGSLVALHFLGDFWIPLKFQNSEVMLLVVFGMFSWIFQVLADSRASILIWLGKGSLVAAATTTGLVVLVISSCLLLPKFGLVAAALSMSFGAFTRAMILVAGYSTFNLFVSKWFYIALSTLGILATLEIIRAWN